MRDYLARKTLELDRNLECAGTADDGEEAVELVERYLPDLRILIVSGYNEFEYARRAIELGVDDYLLKPIDVENLREILRRIRIRLEASAGAVEAEFGLDRLGTREKELAKAVEVFLQENYRRSCSLERLAASFGYKPAYLLRLYRKVTGRTPTQDLIRLRIEKAKRLLAGHPHLEIKQVAAAVGYEDVLYFSRLLKKETGLNPYAFKDSMGRA